MVYFEYSILWPWYIQVQSITTNSKKHCPHTVKAHSYFYIPDMITSMSSKSNNIYANNSVSSISIQKNISDHMLSKVHIYTPIKAVVFIYLGHSTNRAPFLFYYKSSKNACAEYKRNSFIKLSSYKIHIKLQKDSIKIFLTECPRGKYVPSTICHIFQLGLVQLNNSTLLLRL